ncbi:nucleoside monophosphate kinase, partial [Candidatus Wolfebacteria bacterium]|nr:nucleoside monophosphate kinase [Candidatus Wolfebacteria bacterium]
MKQKIAVIIYGPPGSGKGTQAKLLADKLNLFHFDTGDFLRSVFYGSIKIAVSKKEFEKERKLNEAGKLNTPSWILKIVGAKVKNLAGLGHSIVLSGSPRTLYEAFGDKTHEGLFYLLTKKYGRKNIFVLVLEIPEKESLKRNTHRIICSVCKTPILSQMSNCPFCGGKLKHRKDDKKEVILGRLREY